MVIEVVARTTPYAVRLATSRRPGGEDQATVRPGATVTLRSGDVAWGETIDSRLEYTALDGSGTSYVDELDYYSFTRPTRADCQAAAGPPSSVPPARDLGHATVQSAGGGGAFTLRGSGFQPGERVTAHLHDSDAVLGSATAGPDGTVRATIHVPAAPATGTVVDLVGDRSQVIAGVLLQLAAHEIPARSGGPGDLWALMAAAVALVGTVAGLVSVVGRQRASGRGRARIRSV